LPEDAPDDISELVPEELPDAAPEGVPDPAPEVVPDEAPEAVPPLAPEALADAVPELEPGAFNVEVPALAPEGVPDAAPEFAPDAPDDALPVAPDADAVPEPATSHGGNGCGLKHPPEPEPDSRLHAPRHPATANAHAAPLKASQNSLMVAGST
jgi:hypothetical protein